MYDLLAPLIIGFVGSLHCLGMCGPLIMAYSLAIATSGYQREVSSLWLKGLSHHGAFHLGRLITYGFLGAIAAGFAHLVGLQPVLSALRSNVSLLGGIAMVYFGLILLQVLPWPSFLLPSGSPWQRLFSSLFQSRRMISRMGLGLAAGFLPCLLSWAMIVKAATMETLGGGFLTMVLFGLGTIPALLLPGLSASLLSLRTRLIGERVAALSVLVMGLILLFKGAKSFV
jgi:uncharacterized protein